MTHTTPHHCSEDNSTSQQPLHTTDSSQTREPPAILPDREYDFIIYTDGSGHTDGYGGYAAIVTSLRFPEGAGVAAGGMVGTTVNMAEFDAILAGLRLILVKLNIHTEKDFTRIFGYTRPSAIIVSDRMNLVGGVNKVFSRRTDPFLWDQFAWFEARMDIVARHVDRSTNAMQHHADKLASLSRIVIKDFLTASQ